MWWTLTESNTSTDKEFKPNVSFLCPNNKSFGIVPVLLEQLLFHWFEGPDFLGDEENFKKKVSDPLKKAEKNTMLKKSYVRDHL